ncbi:MAG: sulfatase family protein [Phycisphaerae bacterium]
MPEQLPARPNVIWVFGDQHRAFAQSHMGDPNVHTPEMDRMAAEGLTFRRAVAGNPWCTPFRASLITSKYPHHTCVRTPQRLDPSLGTIADPFNDAGYDTAYFGKWHLGGWPEDKGRSAFHIIPPNERGRFRTWIGYENNNSQFDCWVHGHDANGKEIDLYKLPGFETDALTDLLIDYLRRRKAPPAPASNELPPNPDPFFAVLSVQPPHDPYVFAPNVRSRSAGDIQLRPNVPPVQRIQDEARKDLAGYYSLVENLDYNLGRIRRALEETGLWANTHIMFFSDHGDMHHSHGLIRKSVPYEESIRIPFLMGGCREHYTSRGGAHDALINHVDIAPTTLGLCGLDVPDWMTGFDYSGYRRYGQETPLPGEPDSAYLQQCVHKRGNGVDRPWRGIVTRDGWKYVCLENQPYMLINLNEDPYELANHASDGRYVAVREKLQDRLAQWIADTGDSFDLPQD